MKFVGEVRYIGAIEEIQLKDGRTVQKSFFTVYETERKPKKDSITVELFGNVSDFLPKIKVGYEVAVYFTMTSNLRKNEETGNTQGNTRVQLYDLEVLEKTEKSYSDDTKKDNSDNGDDEDLPF